MRRKRRVLHPLDRWFTAHPEITKTAFAKGSGCSETFLFYVLNFHKRPNPERAREWSRRTRLPLEAFLFPQQYMRGRRHPQTKKVLVGVGSHDA